MPGFDGTGPRGMGPMTGGGRGVCNPYSPLAAGAPYRAPGYWPGYGMGMGARAGYGLSPYYRPMPWGFCPAVGWGGRLGMGMGLGRGGGRGRGMGMGRGGRWW